MRLSAFSFLAVSAALVIAAVVGDGSTDQTDMPAYLQPVDGLDGEYYRKTCPDMEAIVRNAVKDAIDKDYTIGPGILRLHFHDCFVRGCDGSVLVDAPGSEKYANASRNLRGFKVIEAIKSALEEKCPKTVSCADILTCAARDATNLIGGPYWSLKYGRKDGHVSLAQEAEAVPMGYESITDLMDLFQSKGLSIIDMIVLSGAHTVGRASCASIQHRLYNFQGTGKPDGSMDGRYTNFLQRKCQNASEFVELDAVTPTKFDLVFYRNLLERMGLLETDQKLIVDSRAGPIVRALASLDNLFWNQFGVSMLKLSRVQVLTGDEGQVRTKCSVL